MVTQISDIVPDAWHRDIFTLLGKHKCLYVTNTDETGLNYHDRVLVAHNKEALRKVLEQYPDKADALESVLMQPDSTRLSSDSAYTFMLSQLCADGLKVFRPTFEQCEMMSRVDISLKSSEYTQPFSTLVIDFPKQWQDKMKAVRKDNVVIAGSILYASDVVVMSLLFDAMRQSDVMDFGVLYSFSRWADEYIEKTLHKGFLERTNEVTQIDNDSPWMQGVIEHRLALNFGLLLSNHECMVAYFNEKHAKKSIKALGKGGPERERAERLLGNAGMHITLKDQAVTVSRQFPAEAHGGTHSSPTPHWRRGHWRVLTPGEGRRWKQAKRVLVAPVLVMGRMVIDEAPNTVAYKLRSAKAQNQPGV